MYADDEEEEGAALGSSEPPSTWLHVAGPLEAKASMDAATVVRKLREEQEANDSPSKRLDALAGDTHHDI